MIDFLRRTDGSGAQAGQPATGEDHVTGLRRRGFLRASAGALSLAGLGVSGTGGAHGSTQTADIPRYAEFVPTDDRFRSEDGVVGVLSVGVPSLIEFFRIESDQQFETTPFQFEPIAQVSFVVGFEFSLFDGLGLGEAIPVAAAGGTEPGFGDIAISELVTDRITSFGNVTVSSGSYDVDEITAAIEESELTESDSAGIFTGPNPVFGGSQQNQPVAVTWSSEHVITGPEPELVAVAEETVQGQGSRLSEQSEDFARQVADAGAGSFTSTGFSLEGPLQVGESDSFVDYSSLRESAVQGYTHSHVVNPGASTWNGTSVLSYETTDDVDEDALSGVGSAAADSSLSRDGRFVTVESDYSNLLPDSGADDGTDSETGGDSGADDGTDSGTGGDSGADDGTDSGTGGDSGADDGTDTGTGGDSGADDGTTDGTGGDDDNSSGDNGEGGGDGSGPGFGALSALAGLGGAGYLLSRRLGGAESGDEQ
ncbi:MAG: hypothetical protein J07HX64_02226 [halophilic archaeon J07HX64]|nr:MAG: hypothetical protein J07HX64_02226 [halophilic archaeon J07HX64]